MHNHRNAPQGSTLTVARLPGATTFWWGQVQNYIQWPPRASASICVISYVTSSYSLHGTGIVFKSISGTKCTIYCSKTMLSLLMKIIISFPVFGWTRFVICQQFRGRAYLIPRSANGEVRLAFLT